jgi:hypothetical protein
MQWIFIIFLVVSLVHMGEEFFYPGGFLAQMRKFNPRFAPHITGKKAFVINALQLVLACIALIVGTNYLPFSLSIAGLILINSLVHIGAAIRLRGYAPGLISSLVLYIPASVFAYFWFIKSGAIGASGVIFSLVLGILYQLIAVATILLSVVFSGGEKT